MSESCQRLMALLLLLVLNSGCRTGAELYAWKTPVATRGAGKRVAIAPLVGPKLISDGIDRALVTSRPANQADITLVAKEELQAHDAIRLVSFEDRPPSDLALLPLARKANVDLLLVGEILNSRFAREHDQNLQRQTSGNSASDNASVDGNQNEKCLEEILNTGRLTVSWKIMDVASGKSIWTRPLTVTHALTASTYPELLASGKTPAQQISETAARETWKLLAPYIDKHRIELAVAYGQGGAKRTRLANETARKGNWPGAEDLWKSVVADHPRQHAAIHNLAIAAVARQDYSAAIDLATRALSFRDCEHYQNTIVWIEARQREYHAAFNLPEPETGWRFAPDQHRTPVVSDADSDWTLKQWITQPIPL